MTREQKIAVVESYISGIGARDFTGVPFAESVSFQSPLTPTRVGRDAIEFLESIFPAIRGVTIKQHIVEGEYVSSVFDLYVTTGTVAVFDKFRVAEGKLHEIRPFYDPALLNAAVEAMGAAQQADEADVE